MQDPRDAQSLNRYTYVYNNPLSYTDPTGYSTECGAKGGEDCPTTVDQQKKEAAEIAAQTNGDSKQSDVNSGISDTASQTAAKRASGETQSTELQDHIKRQAEQAMRSAVSNAVGMDTNEGSVRAKLGEMVRDENGVITKAEFVCDITCRKAAADFTKFTSDEIVLGMMRSSYLRSQREVADGFYETAKYTAGIFLIAEAAAVTAGRIAFMTAREKLAYFLVAGEAASLATGVDGSASAILKDTKNLIPKTRAISGTGKPVVRVDKEGQYIVD